MRLLMTPIVVAATLLLAGCAVPHTVAAAVETPRVIASVQLPNVVGTKVGDAEMALEELNLKVVVTEVGGTDAPGTDWIVASQFPVSSASVGSTVDLTANPPGTILTVSQKQAVIAAKGYLQNIGGFSHQGLIDQLDSQYGNGFSEADATVAVDSLNIDYNAEAVQAAQSYMKNVGGFSHASLVKQLDSPYGAKFTPDQAEYAATQVGL